MSSTSKFFPLLFVCSLFLVVGCIKVEKHEHGESQEGACCPSVKESAPVAPSVQTENDKTIPAGPQPTADPAIVRQVLDRVKSFDPTRNSYKETAQGALIELNINTPDLTLEDMELIAQLKDLQRLNFEDCRNFSDEFAQKLIPLQSQLKVLKIGNSIITDESAEVFAGMPNLVDLNLHHNASVGDGTCRKLVNMDKLEKLNLIYTGTTDVGTLSLKKIPNLKSLDLRGCNVVSNLGMRNVGQIAGLKMLQHRSDAVNDEGLANLTSCENMESLYLQEFSLTDQAGESLSKFKKLNSLIIFRCGEFGTEGLLQLKGLPLIRLTLRGLERVDDRGLEVLKDLPKLKRLYLTEMTLTDSAFTNLEGLDNLEVLELQIVPISDATLPIIAKLPNLKELKLATTEITNDGLKALLDAPKLESLILLDNAAIDADAAKELFAGKKYKVLNIGKSSGEVSE
ncbi:MAG: leucine-rich repeat domain-containing protein [Thermoguttaceae bacterium]